MKLSLFSYNLPKGLIAQTPAKPRDHSRLLIYNCKTKKMQHDYFYNLTKYLKPTDVLVFNDTKVFPARLIGLKKLEAGRGRAEVLLLEQKGPYIWEALLGTNRPKIGLKLRFKHGLEARIVSKSDREAWLLEVNFSGHAFYAILDKIGQMPTPPYITAISSQSKLKNEYQTVYAKYVGSAAAPTAGLHFTKTLLKKIENHGCKIEFVTLNVGLGTFAPVREDNIEKHIIHTEIASIKKQTIKRLLKYKKEGRRIISVGTTSVRTLEALCDKFDKSSTDIIESVGIFIYPGYKFKFIDAMITNFHLPKSTLIMLVAAFIGLSATMRIYKLAIRLKYRFYSFGDAMLLE